MIWLWNPYNHRVTVPDAKVTVHGIQTLEAAHKLMENNFDPSKYQFIAQTKTGMPYNFETLEEAEAFAAQKSNKRSGCTVYSNGKPLVSYWNKQKLPQWQVVYYKKIKDYDRVTKAEFYYRTGRGEGAISNHMLVAKAVETVKDKVRIADIYIQYIKCKNGHLATKFTRDTITFHKDGSVYRYMDGCIKHKSAHDICPYWEDDMKDVLVKELTKMRPELGRILRTCSRWDICGVFSRPTYYYAFNTFHKKAWERNDQIYYGYYPREIVDESKIIDVVAKRMRIPVTKSLRKLYNENMRNMTVVHFLKSIGFKDTNSYQKLTGLGVHFCRYNPGRFAPFVKKLIALRGENHVVKMLADSSFSFIRDSAQSYLTIDEEIATTIMRDARNIEEIHETFNRHNSSSSRLITEREIQYSDKEKERFNFVCEDGIRFELAKSNKDLAVVGYNMGICVGGYGPDALAKRTTIIKMMYGDKHIACIEYRNGAVQQLKAKFNNPVQQEFKNNVDAWLEHGGLECNCSDYRRIGQSWSSNCNYAYVNPRDFVPENEPVLRIIKCKHIRCEHNNNWFKRKECFADRIATDAIYVDSPFTDYVIDGRNEAGTDLRREDLVPAFEAIETDELPF